MSERRQVLLRIDPAVHDALVRQGPAVLAPRLAAKAETPQN